MRTRANLANRAIISLFVFSLWSVLCTPACYAANIDADIAANNSYGPIVDVSTVGDFSQTANADNPWTNFEY